MKTQSLPAGTGISRSFAVLPLGLAAILLLPLGASAVEGDMVAVMARVSEDYVRTKLPDGTFQPETYTFGEGGRWTGVKQDQTIDHLKFLDVARTLAGPLADRNFVPALDAKQTKLLIMVYWGTTTGAAGDSTSLAYQNLGSANQRMMNALNAQGAVPQTKRGPPTSYEVYAEQERRAAEAEFEGAFAAVKVQNHERNKVDWQNAKLLGFDGELADAIGLEYTARRNQKQDLIDEIEDSRYFVVLMAYDFQLLVKEKKHKLLWETRFSIRERRNDFSRALAGMARNASRHFGQDSHGVQRNHLPEGTVEFGELKSLGVVSEKAAP